MRACEPTGGGFATNPIDGVRISYEVFGRDAEDKYRRALEKIGIDLAQLSSAAGHA